MVQTDTGDQGIDVRKEQQKIVAYFEKDPTVNLWVTLMKMDNCMLCVNRKMIF
ncbi:hypothetical protein [Enterococcus faecium]|uniref:hypothetical protein n=1 Tax=Enterococcus faecium TaxID=1352 RepID=UPI0038B925F3